MTTLANEICQGWIFAGGFLVLLIPLRTAQGRSVEEVIARHIGHEEAYKQMKKSRGQRCLAMDL